MVPHKLIKAIIFGVSGQDGIYLNNLLQRNKIEVIGVSRSSNYIQGNIADLSLVGDLIQSHKPDFIFHLAANSSTNHEALFENHETICTGALNILESVRKHSPESKVFIAGSAMQFKNDTRPINELTPFEAKCPYAVARIQSVYAARYFREKFGMKVYIGYLFNHDSPLRSESHINQKIAKAVQRIAAGSQEVIEIGDIEVHKEFGFAGDTVEAIWRLVNQHDVYETVIGTGKPYSIRKWIESCFRAKELEWLKYVKQKEGFISDYKILVSDPQLINSLGWFPKTNFESIVKMMVNNG